MPSQIRERIAAVAPEPNSREEEQTKLSAGCERGCLFVFLYWPGDKRECAPLRRQLRWDHDCNLERQISVDGQCLPTELEPTVGRSAVGRRAAALVVPGFAAQRLQDTDQSASDSVGADSVSLSTPGLSTCALRNTWRPPAGWGGGDVECLGPFHVRVIVRADF